MMVVVVVESDNQWSVSNDSSHGMCVSPLGCTMATRRRNHRVFYSVGAGAGRSEDEGIPRNGERALAQNTKWLAG